MKKALLATLATLPLVGALVWLGLAGMGPGTPGPGWAVAAFGERGRQPGRFVKPRVVACGEDAVFVIDFAGRVQRFSLDGEHETGWEMPRVRKGKPTGADVGPDGLLWVADTHYQRVMVFDREGDLVRSFGEPGEELGQFGLPDDVAVHPDGEVVAVSEYFTHDRLQLFRPDGTPIRTFGETGSGPGQFRRPGAIAWGPEGHLHVADSGNHRIQVLDPATGEVVRIVGEPGRGPGQLQFPMGIAVDEAGRILVAEFAGNRVQMFDASGRFLAASGGEGTSLGRFHTPRGIALGPGRRLYVTDAYNDRVQILQVPPDDEGR